MRETRSYHRNISILAVFLFQILSLFIYKSFVYAEDSMSALVQDVVYAKQKQQAITGKVEAINTVIRSEKTKFLKSEADRLIEELTAQKETKAVEILKPDVKIETAKSPEITPETGKLVDLSFKLKNLLIQDKPVKPSSAKPGGKSKKEPGRYGENPIGWVWPHFGYKGTKLAEGEAIYKVAVSDNKLSLKEAEEIGLANSIQLQAVKKKIEVAQAKITEAKRALFPTLQADMFDGMGKQPQALLVAERFRIFKTTYYKVNMNQPLFYGGELLFTIKQAEENLRSARAELEKARSEALQNIRASFYGVVKAEYNLQYQTELLDRVLTLYRRLKEERAQKLVTEVDYLNAESQYYQAYFQADSARNDLLSADVVLHQALDLEMDQKLPVDLKLNFLKIQPDFNQLLQAAFERNADIKIKESALESAKFGLEIFKSKRLPRFDLRASYGKLGERLFDDKTFQDAGGFEVDFNTEKEWFVIVKGSVPIGPNSIEWERNKKAYAPTVISPTGGSEDWGEKWTFNLLDRFSDLTDQKGAEATLLQAQADYDKAKNDLTLKVRDEFYNLQKSLIQIDSSIAKMRYQEKQNHVQEYLMRLQEVPAPNYLEGVIEHAQDKFSFIQAVTDYHLALSNLSIAIGDPYYFE